MPRIGMRIIKSSSAVFICSFMSFLRTFLPIPIPESGLNGMVFYSSVAAIICIQPQISNSFKAAKDRTIGTLVGGVYGLILLFVFSVMPNPHDLLRYFVISVAIIPLIRFLVAVKYTRTTLLTCTVFLSIAINLSQSLPVVAATNRMLDTILGILVALCVNLLPFLRYKAKEILFVSDLDGTLLNSEQKLSKRTVKKLNYLIKNGANITIATARTPVTIVPLIKDVNFNLPVITMNGAAIYDLQKQEYVHCNEIPCGPATEIFNLFEELGCNCFTHTINNNRLDIYYSKIANPVEREFFEKRQQLEGKTYINKPFPKNKSAIYFTCIAALDEIGVLYGSIQSLACGDQIEASYYKDVYNEGYYFLEIYNSSASKYSSSKRIKQEYNLDSIVAFGDNYNDIDLIKRADVGYAVSNAITKLKNHADHVIESNDSDAVAETIDTLFFHKSSMDP